VRDKATIIICGDNIVLARIHLASIYAGRGRLPPKGTTDASGNYTVTIASSEILDTFKRRFEREGGRYGGGSTNCLILRSTAPSATQTAKPGSSVSPSGVGTGSTFGDCSNCKAALASIGNMKHGEAAWCLWQAASATKGPEGLPLTHGLKKGTKDKEGLARELAYRCSQYAQHIGPTDGRRSIVQEKARAEAAEEYTERRRKGMTLEGLKERLRTLEEQLERRREDARRHHELLDVLETMAKETLENRVILTGFGLDRGFLKANRFRTDRLRREIQRLKYALAELLGSLYEIRLDLRSTAKGVETKLELSQRRRISSVWAEMYSNDLKRIEEASRLAAALQSFLFTYYEWIVTSAWTDANLPRSQEASNAHEAVRDFDKAVSHVLDSLLGPRRYARLGAVRTRPNEIDEELLRHLADVVSGRRGSLADLWDSILERTEFEKKRGTIVTVLSVALLVLTLGRIRTTAPRTLQFGSKIEKQLAKRGWTKELANETVERPARTVPTRDIRRSGGGRMDDPATAYYSKRGGYVVRNDRTGDIVQVSNRNDPGWRAQWD
jgi:hypothetical protein